MNVWKDVLLPPNTFGYNIEEGSDCSIACDRVRRIIDTKRLYQQNKQNTI